MTLPNAPLTEEVCIEVIGGECGLSRKRLRPLRSNPRPWGWDGYRTQGWIYFRYKPDTREVWKEGIKGVLQEFDSRSGGGPSEGSDSQ